MVKHQYDSKDEIPAELAEHYTEKDGKWLLEVTDGALVPKVKLDEFRTTNRTLLKERDELKKTFEGIDPEEAREVLAMRDDLEKGKLKGGKTVDEIVNQRIEKLRDDLTKRATEAEAARTQLQTELAKVKIVDGVTAAALKKGLRQTAIEDLASRAQQAFRLDGTKIVAVKPDGTEEFGKTGEPLTLDEYVDGLIAKAPHLFEPSQGSGAQNGGGGGSGTSQAKNPWKKEHLNMTEQVELVRKDPKLAARLAQAAGAKVTWPV